jgi:hypothetical protein
MDGGGQRRRRLRVRETVGRRYARLRRPGFVLGISLVLGGLTVVTLILWLVERGHAWANNWLPNFVAEWTGILLVVVILERWRNREREAQFRPLRTYCYGELLRFLDNVGQTASSYLERFVTAGPGLEPTDDWAEAVRRMDVALPGGAVTDPNVRLNWWELLRDRSGELFEVCERHTPFLPESVVVPVLELVNAMRACALAATSVQMVWPPDYYVPIGDAFARAHAAVTAAAGERS